MKAASSLKYVEDITSEFANPLNFLLNEHKKRTEQTERSRAVADKQFAAKKNLIEGARDSLQKACNLLDDAILNYDQIHENPKISAEKKKKLAQKITQTLEDCRNNECNFINIVNGAKEARLDYINSLVIVK